MQFFSTFRLTLDDNKIKNWIVESLKIFVETDLLKFDPFGQSESSFAYHHICDLFKLKNFETFKEVREELDDKMKIIFDKVIEDFWENVCYFCFLKFI